LFGLVSKFALPIMGRLNYEHAKFIC